MVDRLRLFGGLLALVLGACHDVAPAPIPPGPKPSATAEKPKELPERCLDGAACEQGCKADHAPSCARLGRMLLHGEGLERDHVRALEVLARGCDKGSGVACAWLASERVNLGATGVEVAELAKRGCDSGSGAACLHLAHLLRWGLGMQADVARAAALDKEGERLFIARCAAEDPDGCRGVGGLGELPPADDAFKTKVAELERASLAVSFRMCGEGDAIECARQSGDHFMRTVTFGSEAAPRAELLEAARGVMTRGCDLDVADACSHLASLTVTPPEDVPALNEKSCRLGNVLACEELAREDVARWRARWLELLRSDCEVGAGDACLAAARALDRDNRPVAEIAPLQARAREKLVATCRLGRSCFAPAGMAEKGQGGPKDMKLALELLEIPCTVHQLCSSLAGALLRSGGAAERARAIGFFEARCDKDATECDELIDALAADPAPDRKRIQALHDKRRTAYEQQCDAGSGAACSTAARLHAEGIGTPKSAAKAKAFSDKACALGFSCD